MCNLYRLHAGPAAIAQLFGADASAVGNHADPLYPGYPGLVVADGQLRVMQWGFPLVLKGRDGRALKPRPVTNARDDKLASGFWAESVAARRCLIPVSAWAEPEGTSPAMTRTWYALDDDPFAVAGLWRPTANWGDCYAMVMTEAAPAMADVHDRMPVILPRAAWDVWTGGDGVAARALCRTWTGALRVERTAERWSGGATLQRDLFGSG